MSSDNTNLVSSEKNKHKNLADFNNYLKKFDKNQLFQCSSSSEIEMYGSEKLLQKKKEKMISTNKSVNCSLDNSLMDSSPRKEMGYSWREKIKSNNVFIKNADKVIIPIEEKNKLEELQTPSLQQISIKRRPMKTDNLDILEQGSKMLNDYILQLKQETKDDSINESKNNISKLSESMEFAIIDNKLKKESESNITLGNQLFSFKKSYQGVSSRNVKK